MLDYNQKIVTCFCLPFDLFSVKEPEQFTHRDQPDRSVHFEKPAEAAAGETASDHGRAMGIGPDELAHRASGRDINIATIY